MVPTKSPQLIFRGCRNLVTPCDRIPVSLVTSSDASSACRQRRGESALGDGAMVAICPHSEPAAGMGAFVDWRRADVACIVARRRVTDELAHFCCPNIRDASAEVGDRFWSAVGARFGGGRTGLFAVELAMGGVLFVGAGRRTRLPLPSRSLGGNHSAKRSPASSQSISYGSWHSSQSRLAAMAFLSPKLP
jgi:hypothetical protein